LKHSFDFSRVIVNHLKICFSQAADTFCYMVKYM